MMFSIIIPIYNSENKLKRCVNSILSQTYSDWELILVNDGSTDQSGCICDAFTAYDSRIKVFHCPNRGVSKARNMGINVSKGEWLTFCDSDDELTPETLSCYLTAIKDGIDIIRGGFVRIKNTSTIIITTDKSVEESKESIIEKCFYSKYEAYVWNSCFRRTIIKDLRFNESISWCEDHLFTFEAIALSNSVAFIPDIVYKYYAPIRNDKSFANNLSTRFIEPKQIMIEAIEERDIKLKMCTDISKSGLSLILNEFNYKVDLALKYAVLGNRYLTGIAICTKYSNRRFKKFISIFLHTKIGPLIRRCFRWT